MHTRERLILIAIAFGLVFSGWCMAGNLIWGVWGLLFFGSLSFLFLWIPLDNDLTQTGEHYSPLKNLKKLIRFPVFWLGLVVIIWMAIAGFNTAWTWHFNGLRWWLEPNDVYIKWLPWSVDAPTNMMNTWRRLLMFLAAWFAGCACWVGLGRKSLRLLIYSTLLNAAAVALYGIVFRMMGGYGVLGFYHPNNSQFFGTWPNPNQGATYLYIHAALAGAMILYHQRRGHLRSGLPLLFGVLLLLFTYAQFVAGSRFGIVAGVAMLALVILLGLVQLFSDRNLAVLGVGVILMISAGAGLFFIIKPDLVLKQLWQETEQEFEENTFGKRIIHYEGNWRMMQDRPWLGFGPGGFRYFIYDYRQQMAEDYALEGTQLERFSRSRPYQAHCDWMQIVIEFGIIGSIPILGMLLWWLFLAVYHSHRLKMDDLSVFAGVILFFAHMVVDFPLTSPALLFLFGITLLAPIKLMKERR